MSALASRAYVLTLLGTLAIIGALLIGHGFVVDPFGLFGTRLVPERGYAAHGRMRVNGDRVVKAIALTQARYDTLILGSSRAQYGLDPHAPALTGAHVYNAALGALEARELVAVLRYAANHQPDLRRVIVGLDAFTLSDPRDAGQGDFALSGFAGHALLDGYAARLFSIDALEGSVRFWRAVLRHEPGDMAMDGLQVFSPELDGDRGAIFRARGGEATVSCGDAAAIEARMQARFDALRAPLATLKARGVALDLYLSPLHVWDHALDALAGTAPLDATYKRLAANLADTLRHDPGDARVTLVDFDDLGPDALEAVPASGSGEETRAFWEPSHFRPNPVGNAILAALGGGAQAGTALTPDTIAADLASIAARRDAWMRTHPDDVAFLRTRADAKRACGAG